MEQKLKTVPEWISRIREQLSVSYAGLGMKEKSDYNRNIYLDILEDTRQDKELESRYQALEKEAGQLTSCCHWSLWASCLYPSFSGFSTSVPKTGTECISAVCS